MFGVTVLLVKETQRTNFGRFLALQILRDYLDATRKRPIDRVLYNSIDVLCGNTYVLLRLKKGR